MAKKYDGWAIKYHFTGGDYISPVSFRIFRKDVIKKYEDNISEIWQRNRRRGLVELVKVKLVEVED